MTAPNTPPANAAMAQSRFGPPGPPGDRGRGQARPDIDFMIGMRVARAVSCVMYDRQLGDPVYRPLRIYALDPAASIRDGALSIVNVPYEPIEIGPQGPRGAILEIIDDPRTDLANQETVDLDDKFLLMQEGRLPSPEDARFRQQMVYAVCTTTYAAFRQALGRDVAWGFRHPAASGNGSRLRVRVSVPELENAFYDRSRGEICFGSFSAGGAVAGRNVPGGHISLCLSHDVVVHEMSHALLDGLRSHFLYPSNLDVLAFHEAFADLIAVFQRFTYEDVVRAAIRASRGDVSSATLLTNIAVQFAQATSTSSALRSAVGGTNSRYEDAIEPHNRGELLVVSVFEAFTTIFNRKTLPLLRLATDGSGVLPEGEISDVLAAQLTERACKLASQFLTICIRAIDYCPPVDITFGEFLRAVITADADVVPHDEFGYREAWIDAFAKRHIYPGNVPSLSETALRWRAPQAVIPLEPELSFARLQFNGDPGRAASIDEIMRQANAFGQLAADRDFRVEFGLSGPEDSALEGDEVCLPVVESIRSSRRVGPSGQIVFDLVAEITQRRIVKARDGNPGFDFYGGATAIIDPKGGVRFVIRKSVLDGERLRRQREFILGDAQQFFGKGPGGSLLPEPKLLLRLHDVTRPRFFTGSATRANAKDVFAETASLKDRSESDLSKIDRSARDLAPTSVTQTALYLLRAGDNSSSVSLLKTCLNRCVVPPPGLDNLPEFDNNTERAVRRLQSDAGVTVDSIVGPATWTVMGRLLKYDVVRLSIGTNVPSWIVRLLANDPSVAKLSGINVRAAFELYQFSYGPLSLSQRDGFTRLLTAMDGDAELTDIRWAAYMLATVKHECAETWRPVEEYGKGAGHPYGVAETVIDSNGTPRQNTYYGRGYVQLTWKDNYEAIGAAIGMRDDLMIKPELALVPDTAFRIMSYGMRDGTFTGKRLATYINATGADYKNARRIINGTDQAERIAGYARQLETILLANIPVAVAASTR
jgi:hypothetical protein